MKPVNIKRLFSSDERQVAELESSQGAPERLLWAERLAASTRGGKDCRA